METTPYWWVSLAGHLLDRYDIAAMLFVGRDALGQAASPRPRHRHHVGQQNRERLVTDDVSGAPYRMAKAERHLLAGETRRAGCWEILPQGGKLLELAALLQRLLKLIGDVEMILDHCLVAAGDEDEMLDSGLSRLIHDMLKDRPIDDGEHLLGDGFGGRKKARAQTGDRKNSLAYAFRHQSLYAMCRPIGFRAAS